MRKLAHGIEFCALGCSVGGLLWGVRSRNKRMRCAEVSDHHSSSALLYLLGVAVTDEYIQSFTGRTSLVSDILIDFCGAVVGLTFVLILMWICGTRRRKTVKKC